MTYMTVKEASIKWNIKERRIRALCAQGRILGAIQEKHSWLIPSFALKPKDQRFVAKDGIINQKFDENEYGDGNFGEFGGCYLSKEFRDIIKPILKEYIDMYNSTNFIKELNEFREKNQFRPTPLYYAEKFSNYLGRLKVYIKREDLNFTNSLYINHAIMLAFLAKRLGKESLYAEIGDANYAISLAYAARHVGLELEIFIGYKEYIRQKTLIEQAKFMGAHLTIVMEGNQTLFDATNSCFRKFLLNTDKSFYCIHDAIGPHPFPTIVELAQNVVGQEAKQDFQEQLNKNPNYVVAPLNIAANALAIFDPYLENSSVKLVGVETTPQISKNGILTQIHGSQTLALFDFENSTSTYENDCPGMNYPALNPKLGFLVKNKRISSQVISNEEAIEALLLFSKIEGIMPSYEDGFTLAEIIKLSQQVNSGTVLMCITGSGIKDIDYIESKTR